MKNPVFFLGAAALVLLLPAWGAGKNITVISNNSAEVHENCECEDSQHTSNILLRMEEGQKWKDENILIKLQNGVTVCNTIRYDNPFPENPAKRYSVSADPGDNYIQVRAVDTMFWAGGDIVFGAPDSRIYVRLKDTPYMASDPELAFLDIVVQDKNPADGNVYTVTSTVAAIVPNSESPVAVAGEDRSVEDTPSLRAAINALRIAAGEDAAVFDRVYLDGSASSDPDGEVVLWEWTLTHRDNPDCSLTAEGETVYAEGLCNGIYDVVLTVTDDSETMAKDEFVLTCAGPYDVNEDMRTGMPEAIELLQLLAGI